MKANAVAGVVSLLRGRHPGTRSSPSRAGRRCTCCRADWFYLVLTAHGLDMLVFWIIFFEIAVLYFCASTLLQLPARHPAHRVGWRSR